MNEKLRKKELTEEQKKIMQDEGYQLIEIYSDEKPKRTVRRMIYKHLRCGKISDVRVDHFFHDGQRCTCLRKLGTAEIKSTNDYQNKIDSVFGIGEYSVTSEYLGRKKPIDIMHKCGYKYTCKRAEYLFDKKGNGGKCPVCFNQSHNTKEILELKFKRCGADLSLLEEFKPGKVLYKVKNNKCGHEYFIRTYDILSHKPCTCPVCVPPNSSKGEIELLEYLKTLNPNFSKKRLSENSKTYEIDCYLEEKHIGFEYDGLYWHSEKFEDSNYHLNKTLFFKNKGIQIVHIYEDEWNYKQDIVKDKIKSILGYNKEKIYARNCYVKEIDSTSRNNFLEINHIQGSDRANISLGLFKKENNELVAVMSFSKLRIALGNKNKNSVYELSRFAGLLNYSIIGGFSKLFKYALKNYKINEVLTYADLRWTKFENNVYDKNKFILDHLSKPSYYYTKDFKTREYRFNYRKNILKKKFPDYYSQDKSEFEIMSEAGYTRIWDCGNLVYRYISE